MPTSMPLRYLHYWVLVLLVVALAGFHPTYFTVFTSANWTQHYHGISAFGFLIAIVVQSFLAQKRKLTLHRILGRVSVILAAMFIHSAIISLHSQVNTDNTLVKTWVAGISLSDFFAVCCFAYLFFYGLKHRNNIPAHARCWAAIALLFIAPALSRAISFWVPGLIMRSEEQFVTNINLADTFSILLAMSLWLHALYRSKPALAYGVATATLVLQFIVIWQVSLSSPWGHLIRFIGDTDMSYMVIAATLIVLPYFAVCFNLLSKRA